jgi:hypothetical protein
LREFEEKNVLLNLMVKPDWILPPRNPRPGDSSSPEML